MTSGGLFRLFSGGSSWTFHGLFMEFHGISWIFHAFGFEAGLMRRLALLALLSPLVYVDVSFNTQGRFRRGKPGEPLEGLFVPTYRGLSLLQEGEAVLLDSEEGGDFKSWLGSLDSKGYWMLDFSERPEAPEAPELQGAWSKPRSAMDALEPDLAAILATAAGLSSWHHSNRFCARCGQATEPCRLGQQRRCTCGQRSRPRLDPAVLVLVTHGQRLLLGRKAQWPLGRYSALAGFVEFGETVEECLVREVAEEAGVQVEPLSIKFVCSQPWLFPRSLLLGFTAEACKDEISVDMEEMEDVRWFHASYVQARLAEAEKGKEVLDNFNIPSRTSLANCLIKRWLQQNT